jgi:hypothetical protein
MMVTIKIAQQVQVQVQQLLQEEEVVAQQVQVLVQPLVVADQRQQVRVAALQVEVI